MIAMTFSRFAFIYLPTLVKDNIQYEFSCTLGGILRLIRRSVIQRLMIVNVCGLIIQHHHHHLLMLFPVCY